MSLKTVHFFPQLYHVTALVYSSNLLKNSPSFFLTPTFHLQPISIVLPKFTNLLISFSFLVPTTDLHTPNSSAYVPSNMTQSRFTIFYQHHLWLFPLIQSKPSIIKPSPLLPQVNKHYCVSLYHCNSVVSKIPFFF